MLPASKRATRQSNRKQGPPADVEARSPASLAKLPPAVQKLYAVHKSDKHKREEATVNHELMYSISSRKKTEVEGIDFSPQKRKAVTEDTPDAPRKKDKNVAYAPTRALIETESTANLVTSNLVCGHCLDASQLEMVFPSCGVASMPTLMCQGCNLYEVANVSKTGIFRSSTHEALIDYDANFKYVLSYVACGDGPTEADRLLTFLSLPNASTMRTNTFKHIEEKCSSYIETVSKESLEKNLVEEVRRTMELLDPSFDFDQWKLNFKSGRANTVTAKVNSTMDMAWQKKSSGLKYDSCSGHAFLYGALTRRAISMCLKSKYCSTCSWWDKNKPTSEVPEHSCTVNHEGSSGSMESDALLEMVISLWDDFHVSVKSVVTDDDSTMKANCKWSNEDWLAFYEFEDSALTIGWTVPDPNKPNSKRRPIKRKSGCLPVRVPEPVFLADPAHRKKTLKSHLYKMLKRKVAERKDLHEGDILRLSHFYHCMVRQLGKGDEKDYVTKGRAVIEHHFDSHEFCGDFCSRKNETGNEIVSDIKKIYRCKKRDKALYEELSILLAPFLTHEALVEVAHGWDTNANESMNNTISWLAPKNKTYAGTVSLRNRVNMALGIQTMGYDMYWNRLFRELGLEIDAATEHRFKQHEKLRQYRLEQSRLNNNKRKRQIQTYIKISKYFDKLKNDRAKGKQYMPGVGMGVAVVEEEGDAIVDKASSIKSNPKGKAKQCPHCGVFGHVTKRSKFCLLVNESVQQGMSVFMDGNKDTDIPLDNSEQAMLEISLLDQLPCVTDGLRDLEDSLSDEDD